MSISFRRAESGITHICAHRGYSLHYPENTLLGFEMAVRTGATSCEIDILLTRDGEAVVIHDTTLDRTTNCFGFVDSHDLEDIRALNAAARFPGVTGVNVPTFRETVEWAMRAGVGLEVELKEHFRPERLMRRVIEVLEETNGFGHVIVISFNHVELRQLRDLEPRIRTEAITHARHADIVGVLKSCGAEAASIELGVFHRDDAEALHAAGLYHRVHIPRPAYLAPYWAAGRDPRPEIIAMIGEGLIDSISGDDVPFLRTLVLAASG